MHARSATVSTWGAVDTTIGKCQLICMVVKGSAALDTITLLDGAVVKYVVNAQITASDTFYFGPAGVGFTNLVCDASGTAGYSITYIPSP